MPYEKNLIDELISVFSAAFIHLAYDVASGSDITTWNKIDSGLQNMVI